MDKAAMIGCCVPAGVGAVVYSAQVRPGSTVAVVGCGGVGLNVIMGAKLVNASKITFTTTLLRAVDTVRNLLLNLRHYAVGPGLTDLENAARGRLVIVVSAGPSLHRSLDLLAAPEVRERAVIIAS